VGFVTSYPGLWQAESANDEATHVNGFARG
jgi:hypothetical protein